MPVLMWDQVTEDKVIAQTVPLESTPVFILVGMVNQRSFTPSLITLLNLRVVKNQPLKHNLRLILIKMAVLKILKLKALIMQLASDS